VQGPALKIIVDREREIKIFVPKPFWQIELFGDYNKQDIIAWHKEDKFWEKAKADEVISKTKDQKEARIDNVERKQFNQMAPFPFDLTSLQMEAYRCFNTSPKDTLEIAQELYTAGFISYPRTSSQQLPAAIGYEKILSDLSKQGQYHELAKLLLKKTRLEPNNGKKTDPAHPAIFPTGIEPKGLDGRESKIYDLIAKRFLSTFAEHAVRETIIVGLNCKDEIFIAKGTRTIEKGWHYFYAPYVKLEEIELPNLKKDDIVKVNKIGLISRETLPPKRYTPASIIKELEKRNLGTKATRSEIIDTLFSRGYVHGKAIEATNLGISTIETLEKYCQKIIDEELTRHFEIEMEKIRERQQKKEKLLEEAKDAITKIIADFKKHEKEIGEELSKANRETQDEMSLLGICPVCKQGNLHIRRGKKWYFAACTKYPDCKTIFNLPSNALLKPAKRECEICKYPMITAIKKGKRPQDFCVNPECESKYAEGEAGKEAKAIAKGEIEKLCPKCGIGKVVLRKSIYGSFYGCNQFPKCRYTASLNNNSKSTDTTPK
jgi:DNA topoisomerase-1